MGIFLYLTMLFAPPGAEATYRDGVALLERGDFEGAIPLLERAAAMDPRNAQYAKAHGVALAAREDYAGSIGPFTRACELDWRLVDACYYAGRALYAANRHQEALAPLEKALKTDAVKGRAETAIAQTLEALGRDAEAEAKFKSALGRKDAARQRAGVGYGRFLARAGRLEEALAILQAAQEPEEFDALLELSRVLVQLDRLDAALPRLERLITLNTQDPAARILLAKVYRRLARPADAVRQEEAVRSLQNRAK